jgi:hypothetical protein
MSDKRPLLSRWHELRPGHRALLIIALALVVPGAVIWRTYFNDDQRLYYLGIVLSLSGATLCLPDRLACCPRK